MPMPVSRTENVIAVRSDFLALATFTLGDDLALDSQNFTELPGSRLTTICRSLRHVAEHLRRHAMPRSFAGDQVAFPRLSRSRDSSRHARKSTGDA